MPAHPAPQQKRTTFCGHHSTLVRSLPDGIQQTERRLPTAALGLSTAYSACTKGCRPSPCLRTHSRAGSYPTHHVWLPVLCLAQHKRHGFVSNALLYVCSRIWATVRRMPLSWFRTHSGLKFSVPMRRGQLAITPPIQRILPKAPRSSQRSSEPFLLGTGRTLA